MKTFDKFSEMVDKYQEPEHFKSSEAISCQADDLHLVDNVAPAYAYNAVHEQENEDAHGRMVLVPILLLIVAAGLMRFWVWPGIRDGMTRAEMAQGEGR